MGHASHTLHDDVSTDYSSASPSVSVTASTISSLNSAQTLISTNNLLLHLCSQWSSDTKARK